MLVRLVRKSQTLRLSWRLSGRETNLSLPVRDNGIGVLPEVIDRVFVPFFTTKPSGSGIGLSICKQIITLHGGHISVESENGKGSCFFLYFNWLSAYCSFSKFLIRKTLVSSRKNFRFYIGKQKFLTEETFVLLGENSGCYYRRFVIGFMRRKVIVCF